MQTPMEKKTQDTKSKTVRGLPENIHSEAHNKHLRGFLLVEGAYDLKLFMLESKP